MIVLPIFGCLRKLGCFIKRCLLVWQLGHNSPFYVTPMSDVILALDVGTITDETERFFHPITFEWAVEKAKSLSLPSPKPVDWPWTNIADRTRPYRKPLRLRNVRPDGNCLPRCISLAITGSEESHPVFRRLVTELLISEGEDRRRMARIAKDKVWMSEKEIDGKISSVLLENVDPTTI